MNEAMERKLDAALERLAADYRQSIDEWKSDRRNAFKDGRMLGYYELKEACLSSLNAGGGWKELCEEVRRRFEMAKTEWRGDRANRFKDGRMLACFEILQLFPA